MNDWILECNDVGMMQITPFLMVSARVANGRVFKVYIELKDPTFFLQEVRGFKPPRLQTSIQKNDEKASTFDDFSLCF